jgi:hypothetical protein
MSSLSLVSSSSPNSTAAQQAITPGTPMTAPLIFAPIFTSASKPNEPAVKTIITKLCGDHVYNITDVNTLSPTRQQNNSYSNRNRNMNLKFKNSIVMNNGQLNCSLIADKNADFNLKSVENGHMSSSISSPALKSFISNDKSETIDNNKRNSRHSEMRNNLNMTLNLNPFQNRSNFTNDHTLPRLKQSSFFNKLNNNFESPISPTATNTRPDYENQRYSIIDSSNYMPILPLQRCKLVIRNSIDGKFLNCL